MVDTLLHKKPSVLPAAESEQALAEKLSDFFRDKIVKIRNEFDAQDDIVDDSVTPSLDCSLDVFTPVTEDDIRRIIGKSPNASCNRTHCQPNY